MPEGLDVCAYVEADPAGGFVWWVERRGPVECPWTSWGREPTRDLARKRARDALAMIRTAGREEIR